MEDITWKIIDNYFLQGGNYENVNILVNHQIESYNDFIDKKILQIIQGFNPIQIYHNFNENIKDFTYKIFINVNNPSLSKPIFQSQDGSKQLMTPHLARLNGLTYGVNLYTDIQILVETINSNGIIERNEIKVANVIIGKIPIMVKSKACILNTMPGIAEDNGKNECRYDPGGYFIINGNEKVIISQDRIAENKCLIFSANGSVTDGLTAEIRSVQDGIFLPPKTTSISMSSKPTHLGRIIRINSSFLRVEVPLFIIFRALGIVSDKEIIQHIVFDVDNVKNQKLINELAATIEDASDIYTQEDAITYLTKYIGITGKPKEYLEKPEITRNVIFQIIKNDFLPHVGPNLCRKAAYLGYMVRKLLNTYLGYKKLDNRDSYIHKRIDTPGILLSNLFRQCYGKLMKDSRNSIQRELQLWRATPNIPNNIINATNIHRFFKQSVIEMGIRYALATGNWGVKTLGSFQNIRSGVAQVLNRMSYLSTLSHLRRINTPMEKNGKLVQPRKLENTQFGMICLAETPEGAAVGLVKNMALSTKISISMNGQYIREIVENMDTTYIYRDNIKNKNEFLKIMGSNEVVMVQINGDIIGYNTEPVNLYNTMKTMKRKGNIPVTTSIAWDIQSNILMINTESGRLFRPFLIVDNTENGSKLRLEKLIEENPNFWKEMKDKPFIEFLAFLDKNEEGFIEYLDVEEIDKSMIAISHNELKKTKKGSWIPPKYTHCEINPSLIMGVLACNIPFSDHNQSPRNCYQSAMGKQAVGIYMSNYNNRIDTFGHILNYSQKPLARTKLAKYTNSEAMPSGINTVIAIMTKTGFNQEDSVMINKSALDRGLFTSTYFKSYKDQCLKNHSTGEEEKFTKPPIDTINVKPYNYDNLTSNGFVNKNTYINDGDIIIGKVMPQKINGINMSKDVSIPIKANDNGYIDMNYQGVNNDGYKFCKVRLRKYRKPTVGDKVSSRHGQKGTIGMLYSQEDMPFSKEGITPDIIVNPHAIPSRMTVGQLIECIMGKSSCLLGSLGDATPFNGCDVENIANILESYGMERYGNEILYNGRTGEMIHTEIFMGPTFYQRLKHMVADKMHGRGNNGPVVMITRQPAEGRARNGGLRFGEMERDAIVAHGAGCFLKERMLDVSDNYRVFVCKKCGLFCTANPNRNIYKCNICKNQSDIVQIRTPYCAKLLIQELMTMGIGARMNF
jgi:DNA-directed RNA polymerase II subunit RPB2